MIEEFPPIKLSQVEYRSFLVFGADSVPQGPVETVWQAEMLGAVNGQALWVSVTHPLRSEAEHLAREKYRTRAHELEAEQSRESIDRAKQELQRLFNAVPGMF